MLEKARTKETYGKTRTGVRVGNGTAQRQKHDKDSHKKEQTRQTGISIEGIGKYRNSNM